ncbi:BadF/BadG/BcrA/BcrD ATPase family protein [Kistimonas asteriae]|uniref:BadF/BadG/BcrA/BcrD ATPase family protein n=1 Tax=Kistimonas asteriae TaxID=517724 RepID=UPI001BAD8E15|nr:BadF/BadG/BcrA/BcrD ATPase family protein [Kistimonas asteriae]
MTEKLFLGIDGGGTSCRARLCDGTGQVLGEGLTGIANPRFGLDQTCHNILLATRQALQQAGLQENDMQRIAAGFGLAGINHANERNAVMQWGFPFASLVMRSDAYTACLGAFDGGNGAILIMGTGSCGFWIRDNDAGSVGGWGFPVSDHASGARLGLDALSYALRAHEGIVPATPLCAALMARFDNSPEAVIAWQTHALPRDYGAFAPVVFDYADKQDSMAIQLLQAAAEDAAAMIRALLDKGVKQCALVGGISGFIRPWLPEAMTPYLVAPKGDALSGALIMAREDQ